MVEMVKEVHEVPEAFVVLAELAEKEGAIPVSKFEGCWVRGIDDSWLIAMNGHEDPRMYGEVEVPPFTCYIEWNGFPAGLLDPTGGTIAAGELANEESFIKAIRVVIDEHSSV